MEEQLAVAVRLDLVLGNEVEDVSKGVKSLLNLSKQQAAEKQLAFQGQNLHGLVLVQLPEGQLRNFFYYFTNLRLNVQLYVSQGGQSDQTKQKEAEAKSQAYSSPVAAPSLGVAQSLPGPFVSGPGTMIEPGTVAYQFTLPVTVQRSLLDREVTFRLVLSPPIFPQDEATFPIPFLHSRARSEATARSLHGIYLRGVGSKGIRPTLDITRSLKVIDPLEVVARCIPVNGQVMLQFKLSNNQPTDSSLQINNMYLCTRDGGESISWDFVKESGGGPGFPLKLEAATEYSLACRVPATALNKGIAALFWWCNRTGSKVLDPILKILPMDREIEHAGNPEQDPIGILIECSTLIAVGDPGLLHLVVENRSNRGGTFRIRLGDDKRSEDKSTEQEISSHQMNQSGGVLLCLARSIEVGFVASGQRVATALPVMGVRGGVAHLEPLEVEELETGRLLRPRISCQLSVIDLPDI